MQAASFRSPVVWPVLGEVTDLRHTLAGFVDPPAVGSAPYRPKTYPGHALLAFVLFITVIPAVWSVLMYLILLMESR